MIFPNGWKITRTKEYWHLIANPPTPTSCPWKRSGTSTTRPSTFGPISLVHIILFLCILLPLFLTHALLASTIQPSSLDTLFITLYHIDATTCFLLSSTFHTFSSHSPNILDSTSTLDHIGIIIVIYTSTLSIIHFIFCCPAHHRLRNAYMAISTFLALVCIVLTFFPSLPLIRSKSHTFKLYTNPKNTRVYKWLSHSLFGLSAFLPIFHASTLYSPAHL